MSRSRKPPRRSLPIFEDAPEGWHRKAAVTLIRFHGSFERRVSQILAGHGMTLAQFDLLMTLCAEDGITQQEVAERLLVTKANVVGLIDRASAAGWLERRTDPEDRRANRISLTAAGRKLAAKAHPDQDALVRKVFGELSETELRQLHATLRRCEAACQEEEG